jgi:hypothetical protein
VIVIDYLSLLSGTKEKDFWMKLGEAAASAQQFAIANNNALITVCQTKEDGDVRLSEQIKDNAGLMWVWEASEASKAKSKKERDQQHKSEFDKRGIDFIEIMMPKSRMQKPFLMRLYRSTGHTQVASNPKDLQKPWIDKFPQAADIYAQRPWENGIEEAEEKQKELDAKRRKRRKQLRERARELVKTNQPKYPVTKEIRRRGYQTLMRFRYPNDTFSNDNEYSEESDYYYDENPSAPDYNKKRRTG